MDDKQRIEGKDFMPYKWTKKVVDKNDGHPLDFYRKHLDYYILNSQSTAAVVAFMFVLDRPKPDHIEFCSDTEIRQIESIRSGNKHVMQGEKPFYEESQRQLGIRS